MRVRARATRVGVLKYRKADGTILRELRHPDEVFNPDSMATLAMKPVTNNHPSTMLDSENARDYAVGFTGESVEKADEKFLDVMTVITDRKTISDAESGKVEVSCGYLCELEEAPGVFDGEEYDVVQRNIRYNHLAVVNKGRAGAEVRLRLDADDAASVDLNPVEKETKKMKVKLDGKEYEVEDEFGEAFLKNIKKKKKSEEESEEEKEDLKSKKDEAEKARDTAQAKADGYASEIEKLKKERTDASSIDVPALVRARKTLESVAEKAGLEKFDAMDDATIRKEVIKVVHNLDDKALEGKSEDYLSARFDVAAESLDSAEDSAKKLGGAVNSGSKTETKTDSEDARQKMIERNRNAWKNDSSEKKGN